MANTIAAMAKKMAPMKHTLNEVDLAISCLVEIGDAAYIDYIL